MLEWRRHSRPHAVGTGVGGGALIGALVGVEQGFDYGWLRFWQAWVLLALAGLGMYALLREGDPAVGAEWLRIGRGWVLLYELTEIEVRYQGLSPHLHLTDIGGRSVRAEVDGLRQDRDMWDLIHNGLSHSVLVNGARTNHAVHSLLLVPAPPV